MPTKINNYIICCHLWQSITPTYDYPASSVILEHTVCNRTDHRNVKQINSFDTTVDVLKKEEADFVI